MLFAKQKILIQVKFLVKKKRDEKSLYMHNIYIYIYVCIDIDFIY